MSSSRKNTLVALLVSIAALSIQGCASMSDVIKNKSQGTVKVYPIDADQAWKIARQVFRWEGADAIEEHRDENMMLTSSSASGFTWGTYMGAWIEPAEKGTTAVTIVTKRRMSTNLATTLTETTFHSRFQQALEIIQSGKPLPIEAPSPRS